MTEGDGALREDHRKPALKLTCGRFDGEGFPLDGIQELAKYQRLVHEVAMQTWAEANFGKRLPVDYAAQGRPRLAQIKPASQNTFFASDEAFPGIPAMRELSELSVSRKAAPTSSGSTLRNTAGASR